VKNWGKIGTDDGFEVRGVECLGACMITTVIFTRAPYKRKIDQLITDCRDNKIILHDK
jgi:NADH-quinone oxidoreductase subunit E